MNDSVLLEVAGLRKAFGGVVAVEDVSLTARRHEVVGLIGPNGAGKTTLFNLISGFTRPTAGSIHWDGTDVTRMSPARRARRGCVRTFQQARGFPKLTGRDNLRLACLSGFRTGLGPDLLGTRSARTTERRVESAVSELIENYGLEHLVDRPSSELSYGSMKRLGMVMAIASRPQLLMLDEPAAGLNHHEVEILHADLERLRDSGVTIWVVEHNMGLVMSVCERIVVLDRGVKIADGTPAQVAADPVVITAYLGGAE